MNTWLFHIAIVVMSLVGGYSFAQGQHMSDSCKITFPTDVHSSTILTKAGCDRFLISTNCDLDSFHITIYNRQAEVMIMSSDIHFNWDLKKTPADTYYYVVAYKFPLGNKEIFKGVIHLFD